MMAVFDGDQRGAVFPRISASLEAPMADMRKVLAIFIGLGAITALWFFGLVVSGGFGLP